MFEQYLHVSKLNSDSHHSQHDSTAFTENHGIPRTKLLKSHTVWSGVNLKRSQTLTMMAGKDETRQLSQSYTRAEEDQPDLHQIQFIKNTKIVYGC